MVKEGLRIGGKALVSYVIAALLCMMICVGITGDWYWLSVVLNVALFALMVLMMFITGGSEGEKACTTTARIEHIEREGRQVDPKLLGERFDKRVALIAFLTCALPLMIVAGVNLAVEPMYPQSENAMTEEELNQFLAEYEAMSEEEKAAADEQIASQQRPVNWVNVAARSVFMTCICLYAPLERQPHALNLLFLVVAVVSALPTPIGYLCGPMLRKKKLLDIERGKKRKMRKLRVHQQPKKPKMEV